MRQIFQKQTNYAPLNRENFARDFDERGSKIKNPHLYQSHTRTIFAEEKNYLGLCGLDTALINRMGDYRMDDVTPDENHQIDIFFQIENFKRGDENHEVRGFKYLPEYLCLDLMQSGAMFHDEIEDDEAFTLEILKQSLYQFAHNIDEYVTLHRQMYPNIKLEYPSQRDKDKMFQDIPKVVMIAKFMTKDGPNYFDYTRNMLGYSEGGILIPMSDEEQQCRAITCVLKVLDRAVNISSISVRSQKIIEAMVNEDEISLRRLEKKYYRWAHKQLGETRDIFFNRAYSKENIDPNTSAIEQCGFISEMMKAHPETKHIGQVLKPLLNLKLQIYDRDLANHGEGLELMTPSFPEYQAQTLSPRADLLNITIDRLKETHRIDAQGTNHPIEYGMYGALFPEYQAPRVPSPIPLKHLSNPLESVLKQTL